jgi:hypothetical protein
MGAVKPRTYAGKTGDERVAQRRDALVDAAFGLVAARRSPRSSPT